MDIRTLHIADIELPPSVERLRDLAYDLWWSWSPLATRLFAWIDPEHWRRYHNPVQLLINVEPQQWMRLLADPEFRRTYETVIQALDEYRAAAALVRPGRRSAPGGPVAYFSMEFGIHESLGVYSGGLGVLAGDHCKAASDLGVPLVGVGLLYRSGYFRQTVDADGFQQHIYPDYDFARLPVLPVQAPGRRRADRAHRPARPHRAGRGLEGPGRPRAGADAGHRHPAQRPRRPADHRHPLRARPRDAPVPGDRARGGRRARRSAPSASTPRSGT